MKNITTLFMFLIIFAACKNKKAEQSREEIVLDTDFPKWTILFDGSSTKNWRGYKSDSLPDGWGIEDKTLKSSGNDGETRGDIIYDAEMFGEFELTLDWKISAGSNSGIFYHVVEGAQFQAPYQNAPEYQVIDQLGYPNTIEPLDSLAANVGMYYSDVDGAVKSAGKWNSTRIICTNEKVEYYLNGKQTLSFVPWSEDWNNRKRTGQWKDYPTYGMAKEGYIGLQDPGNLVWFKNIKIRKL